MTDSTLATVESAAIESAVIAAPVSPAPTHLLPDLVEIQRASFRWFLSE